MAARAAFIAGGAAVAAAAVAAALASSSPLAFLVAVKLLLTALAVAAASFAWWGFHIPARRRLAHLPGPPPRWLIGSLLHFRGRPFHELYDGWARRYGPIFRVFIGKQPTVVISHPELVRQVCVKHFDSFRDRAVAINAAVLEAAGESPERRRSLAAGNDYSMHRGTHNYASSVTLQLYVLLQLTLVVFALPT